uniref:Dual serine/threonine and tyrosine protein kinase n=1 Tax=Macrostomum lignano TaxID=282301 RepID=A0A1I8HXQ2_9PLAT
DEDRENDELISSTVEAGIKCEFLRHGIDIIDSPGLNENSSLDSLTLGAIDSFLPIIIYVIDSNSGVTVAVQKDLQTIQKTASGAEILYLITKMDVADHLAAEMGREVAEMEAEKADHVFSKLQRLGYISKDATRQSCRKFLCVSCWEVRRFRRKKEMIEKKMKKSKTAESGEKLMSDLVKEMENSKWVRQFEEVKRRILQFAQDQFKNLIVGAGSSLRAVHCQILTMFMDKAHDIKESNQRKKKALYQIKSLEHEIHQQSKSIVERHRGEFLAQANRFFAEKKPLILDEVRSMSYSDSVISEGMSQRDIEKKCIEEIHTLINDRIIATFSDFLRDNVLRTCFTDFDDLKEKVAEYEKDVEQTPAYQVLKKTLLEGYSLSSKAIVRGSVTCFIRNIGSTLRALLKHPDIFLGKAVQHHKWKEHQASQYLKNIDREKLVACLVSSIGEWFDKRHSDFLHSMSYSEVLVEKSYRMTDRERKEIIKLSPIVALLHMNAFAIITRYKFRNHRLDLDNCLGSGAQGRVYTVLSPTGEPVMAAKKIVTNRAGLEEIAAEAYYSSVLEHPNIVRVVGTVLLENAKHNGQWSVELYMELMHCDALTLMEQQRLSLAKRLWLGLQISKALEFLHSSQLIHRDVKLANLLVNSEATVAKLSDFGLLKGQGLVGHTLVGTPIYLSPELVRRENYGVSTDIFSLGIALWYLVEGSGQHHPDYVTNLKTVEEVLAATSERGCRPNRLPEASDQLWQLMVRCWDETPAKRPTAGQIDKQQMAQLSNYLDQFLLNRQRLANALDEVRCLVEEARQIVAATSAERLEAVASEVEKLLRLRGRRGRQGDAECRVCLLIVGQTKAGKSSFINELLGQQVLAQSQHPCTSQVVRIVHSAEPFDSPIEDPEANGELSPAVIGRPSEFLLASGLDLVDTPGLNENARLDELTLSAVDAFLPLVVYVINANNGVSRMVEADIVNLQTRVGGPDKLFYLATHMDIDDGDISAGCGRTRETLEREKLQRLLAGLRRLGCIIEPESGKPVDYGKNQYHNQHSSQQVSEPPCSDRFCCISSRIVATVRRRHRRQQLRMKQLTIASDDEARWLEAFQLAKSSLSSFAKRRLTELPLEAATSLRRALLDYLHKDLDEAASLASEEACHRRRLTLLDAGHAAVCLLADSESAASGAATARNLVRWLTAALKQRCSELAKASAGAAESPSRLELLDILTDRIGGDFDFALPRLADCFQRGVSLAKQVEEAAGGEGPQKLVPAATEGFRVPERSLRRQLAELLLDDGCKPPKGLSRLRLRPKVPSRDADLRRLNVEEFLVLQDLRRWFEELHRGILAAVQAAEDRVQLDLRTAMDRRRLSLALLPLCLKISLQLDSVATECGELQLCGGESDEWKLVASGSQGSKLYRCGGDLAVKEMMLSDRQLGEIAPGLHVSREMNENLVHIAGLRLYRLTAPDVWRLQLYMPFMADGRNLLDFLALQPSLRKRLAVGLATADALAKLHSESRLAHGNLHAANVFVIRSGTESAVVKLSDLGQQLLPDKELPDGSKPPGCMLFSQLVSQDVCCLGRILQSLTSGPAVHAVPVDFELTAEASADLDRLLLECQPDPLAPAGYTESSCSLTAGQVANRLRALLPTPAD